MRELGAAIAEGTQHERPWPEIWGFSSGKERSEVRDCWESGKSKLNSSVLGMMQQTNFAEESGNFRYQGTHRELEKYLH